MGGAGLPPGRRRDKHHFVVRNSVHLQAGARCVTLGCIESGLWISDHGDLRRVRSVAELIDPNGNEPGVRPGCGEESGKKEVLQPNPGGLAVMQSLVSHGNTGISGVPDSGKDGSLRQPLARSFDRVDDHDRAIGAQANRFDSHQRVINKPISIWVQ